jgi:hypothetical protein
MDLLLVPVQLQIDSLSHLITIPFAIPRLK